MPALAPAAPRGAAGILSLKNLCFFAHIELVKDYVRFSDTLKTEALRAAINFPRIEEAH